jgi:S1-C subfamily serine protease
MSPQSGSTLGELSLQLAGATETAGRAIVAIHARRRIPSSGIIWRDGVIVSASHTVRRDDEITVTLASGEKVGATVAGRDPATDLIALRARNLGAPGAVSTDADAARVGSLVLAVGRPGREVSASFGIVSAVGRGWRTMHGTRVERVLRLDLAVYDGFSGGALVDAGGAILGLNNSAIARGAAMALPSKVVDRIVDELLQRGHVRRPFIGIAVHPVDLGATAKARHKLEGETALMVMSVADGSPAEASGLTVGDVLVAANGAPLTDPTSLLDTLAQVAVGGSLQVEFVRSGTKKTLAITPVDRTSEGAR